MADVLFSEKLAERIRIVLDSDETSYAIEKETGISRASISRYRRGQLGSINMTIETAQKFEKFGIKYGLYAE